MDEETEKRRDLDWDSVESTESVYEPEPENPYQPVSVVIEGRHQEEAVEEPDNTAHIQQFDEVQSNFGTSSHDANEETKEADTSVGEEEYSYTEPAVAEEVSDLGLTTKLPILRSSTAGADCWRRRCQRL